MSLGVLAMRDAAGEEGGGAGSPGCPAQGVGRGISWAGGSPENLGRRMILPDTQASVCREWNWGGDRGGLGGTSLPSCPQIWKLRLVAGRGRMGLGFTCRLSAQGTCPSPACSGRLRRVELGPSKGGFQAPNSWLPRTRPYLEAASLQMESREGARGEIIVGSRWALHPVAGVLIRGRRGRF